MTIALNRLRPVRGTNRKSKRVGRGIGSGHGKTATRGYKGQKSRSGFSSRAGFEGGQMPLYRRLPKRGFNNIFREEYAVVNLEKLAKFKPGAQIDPEVLLEKGIIKKIGAGLKILGQGSLKHPVTVRAHKFSKSAEEKIRSAGGSPEVIGH